MPSTIWSIPNFASFDGQLYTADATNTPFLAMIGGLTGGRITQNFEFPTSSEYAFPAAAQPAITETASLIAPAQVAPQAPPVQNQAFVRNQNTNVTQIFHEAINLSYVKLSNGSRLTSAASGFQVGDENAVMNELAFQQARKLEKIARDVEFSFIRGAYALAANQGQANTTRGMEASAVLGGSVVAGGGAQLTRAMMQNLFLQMFNAGATFSNAVIYTGGALKQRISDIYSFAPASRNVGGVNIEQIETDFGNIGIVVSRFANPANVLVAEVSVCEPVFQPVPGKGNLFYEELARTGAGVQGQMFGQIGLNHGPHWMHGIIQNVIA